MSGLQVFTAVSAGITLLEELLPLLQAAKLKGEVTPEQQGEVLAKYASLKDRAEGVFAGPGWKIR